MLDLNKFTGTKKEDILHSNGIAKDATSGLMGAAGGISFQQRLNVAARNARVVQGYSRSIVGMVRIDRRAQAAQHLKRYQPSEDASTLLSKNTHSQLQLTGGKIASVDGRQAFNASSGTPQARMSVQPQSLFREPVSTHNFDPYR